MSRPTIQKTRNALLALWDLGAEALQKLPNAEEDTAQGRRRNYVYSRKVVEKLASRWSATKKHLKDKGKPERYLRWALALVDEWRNREEMVRLADLGFSIAHAKLILVKQVAVPGTGCPIPEDFEDDFRTHNPRRYYPRDVVRRVVDEAKALWQTTSVASTDVYSSRGLETFIRTRCDELAADDDKRWAIRQSILDSFVTRRQQDWQEIADTVAAEQSRVSNQSTVRQDLQEIADTLRACEPSEIEVSQ